jgi:predicted DNA-binding transcriptional regulator AlpA
MRQDMLDLLRLDPGTRTLGQLLQEREWAYTEISRLRSDEARQIQRAKTRDFTTQVAVPNADATLDRHRLVRLPEVCRLTGLGRSSVYKHIADGRFPAPLKLSERSVRWRLNDVLDWQNHVQVLLRR